MIFVGKKMSNLRKVLPSLVLMLSVSLLMTGQQAGKGTWLDVKENVQELMERGDIPGMSLVILREDGTVSFEHFGSADLGTERPVTADTLYELASLSKSFTALGVLRLVREGKISLDDPVSRYFPGFHLSYEGEKYEVTIRQLLHHTSGIPWKSITLIKPGSGPDDLKNVVGQLSGYSPESKPGEAFRYATANYDILGAVIEVVMEIPFEDYMQRYIFTPLGLTDTSVGIPVDPSRMAVGYKIGFFSARRYTPPPYRGNYPAGYLISDPEDIARWLKIQAGLISTDLDELVRRTHRRDETVAPQDSIVSSYGMGWYISLKGDGQIFHDGVNPGFSSFISFIPGKQVGVAVLTNSNSSATPQIGRYVIKYLCGENLPPLRPVSNKIDLAGTILSLALALYLLITLLSVAFRIRGFIRGKNEFEGLTWRKLLRLLLAGIASFPFLLGGFLLPRAALGMSWQTVLVWGPFSLYSTAYLFIAAFIVGFIRFLVFLLLPHKNRYLNEVPTIVFLGILTGLANTGMLFIITTSFYSSVPVQYLLFYFFLIFSLFIFGSKMVATKMIKITNNITLDLRTNLVNKLISGRFQSFEKLQDGRVLTTLNDDTTVIAGSANLVVGAITNLITALSAFIYLSTISMSATLVVLLVVAIMVLYYYAISKISRTFLEAARTTQNVYMGLLNGLIRGFKELSLHFRKRKEYRSDLLHSCREFCTKNILAAIKFLNSRLIGNAFILIILGLLSIVVPRVLVDVKTVTLISYIMVLLYLMGPINALLAVIPSLTHIKVSWDRIQGFIRALDQEVDVETVNELIKKLDAPDGEKRLNVEFIDRTSGKITIDSLKVEGLEFEYDSPVEKERFSVGPIDLEVKRGEALFIIGGNGSGKTTLAKILTGLYKPKSGIIRINGTPVDNSHLGEYYSTIFSDFHLFQKLYGVDTDKKEETIAEYLKKLELAEKIQVENNHYSSIDLSGGQRKRLALFQCFLENRPIYIFDEFAANQDPDFRRFFYRQLLPKMKAESKIIIAVTHDDHYFDLADKIIKLDMGKIDHKKFIDRTLTP